MKFDFIYWNNDCELSFIVLWATCIKQWRMFFKEFQAFPSVFAAYNILYKNTHTLLSKPKLQATALGGISIAMKMTDGWILQKYV